VEDITSYQDRIRSLLGELEKKTEVHIAELNDVHDNYRSIQVENTQLREQAKHFDYELDRVTDSERESRQQLVKLRLQNESLMRALGR